MGDKKPVSVKYNHIFPDEYKILAANGAWGGVSARGDMLMHFFIEQRQVPKTEIKCVGKEGELKDPKGEPENIEVERLMQVGIMMNREQAASLAHWIIDKLQHFETLKK